MFLYTSMQFLLQYFNYDYLQVVKYADVVNNVTNMVQNYSYIS